MLGLGILLVRRPMTTLCYVASGVLLIGTGLLFNAGALSAATLTACWVKEVNVFYGYLIGAVLMIAAGSPRAHRGRGRRQILEDVAKPLTAEEEAEAPA